MSLIEKYCLYLVDKEPFYSRISRNVEKFESKTIKTACVFCKDNKFYLAWSKKYLESLNRDQAIELMKHEFLHISFGHCTNRKKINNGKEDKVYGWACDFTVNSFLDENNLPPGGLIPGKIKRIPKYQESLYDPEKLRKIRKLENLILSLPKGKSVEWYFKKLDEDEEIRQIIEELSKEEGNDGMDEHNWETNLSDDEIEMLDNKRKRMLENAAKESDKNGKWGTGVSSSLVSEIRTIVSNHVDWRLVLNNFCGSVRTSNRTSTYKRMSRRVPDLLPGIKRTRKSRIVIAVDQSTSITDQILEMFVCVIQKLAEIVEFTFVPFSETVKISDIFVWNRNEKVNLKRSMLGGTNFSAPTEWLNENREKYDGLIILTDGKARKPISCSKKRLWILPPGHSLSFLSSEQIINIA